MPIFQSKYDDFSDLEELAVVLADQRILVLQGRYDASQPTPGAHVMLSSENSRKSYDFIKRPDGSYVVHVHESERP